MTNENDLSSDEKRAIASLRRLAKRWPKTLWLHAGASGGNTVCVMRKIDGERALCPGGLVDQAAVVAMVEIECEGGDF